MQILTEGVFALKNVRLFYKQNDRMRFISHLDTSEDAPGKNIKPQIINNYNGQDIDLTENKQLSVSEYPDLKNHKGKGD